MKPNPYPGKFIVIEGLDGAGTTTQTIAVAEILYEKFGLNVLPTFEPTSGIVGKQIRSILSGRTVVPPLVLAALFAADRMDHLYGENGIIGNLLEGEWVISDRYFHSSYAYQSIEMNEEELSWLDAIHAEALIPDLTIFIDVPIKTCLQRITSGRHKQFEIYEKENILKKISLQYSKSIKMFHNNGHNIEIIDGKPGAQKVTRHIIDCIKAIVINS